MLTHTHGHTYAHMHIIIHRPKTAKKLWEPPTSVMLV